VALKLRTAGSYWTGILKMDFSEEEAEKICRLNALKMINK
jgi:hypothetical protein